MNQKIVQRNKRPKASLGQTSGEVVAEFTMNAQMPNVPGNCVDRDGRSV